MQSSLPDRQEGYLTTNAAPRSTLKSWQLASPGKLFHGGDEEDRTPDPLRARQVLSQLSYVPMGMFPHHSGEYGWP